VNPKGLKTFTLSFTVSVQATGVACPLAVWQDILKTAKGSLGTRRGGFGGEYRFLTVVFSCDTLINIRLGGVASPRGWLDNTLGQRAKHMTNEWLTYPRIVVLLLGIFFAGFLVWMLQGLMLGTESKRWWELALLLLIAVFAVILIFVGVFGSNRMVEKWGDSATTHEASVVVMIVAAPIYWLLKIVTGKK